MHISSSNFAGCVPHTLSSSLWETAQINVDVLLLQLHSSVTPVTVTAIDSGARVSDQTPATVAQTIDRNDSTSDLSHTYSGVHAEASNKLGEAVESSNGLKSRSRIHGIQIEA